MSAVRCARLHPHVHVPGPLIITTRLKLERRLGAPSSSLLSAEMEISRPLGPDLEWVVFIRVQKVGSTSAEHHLRATLNSSLGWGATHTFGWEPLHCQSCSGYAAIAPCSTRASCFALGGACNRGPLPRLLVDNVPHVTLRDAAHLLPLPVRSPRVAVLTWLRHPYT